VLFSPEISAVPPYLGQDYEENGVDEKRGRVRLNRLSSRKLGERYGARKAEIGRDFQKLRKSAGVEKSRISRGFGKQRKDRGTSGRILGCLTVRASRNSIFIQQSLLVLPSHLALPFLIALPCLLAVVSLLVLAALLLGAFSQTETHGSPCLREMGIKFLLDLEIFPHLLGQNSLRLMMWKKEPQESALHCPVGAE